MKDFAELLIENTLGEGHDASLAYISGYEINGDVAQMKIVMSVGTMAALQNKLAEQKAKESPYAVPTIDEINMAMIPYKIEGVKGLDCIPTNHGFYFLNMSAGRGNKGSFVEIETSVMRDGKLSAAEVVEAAYRVLYSGDNESEPESFPPLEEIKKAAKSLYDHEKFRIEIVEAEIKGELNIIFLGEDTGFISLGKEAKKFTAKKIAEIGVKSVIKQHSYLDELKAKKTSWFDKMFN